MWVDVSDSGEFWIAAIETKWIQPYVQNGYPYKSRRMLRRNRSGVREIKDEWRTFEYFRLGNKLIEVTEFWNSKYTQ
jgi:hypothetical protein